MLIGQEEDIVFRNTNLVQQIIVERQGILIGILQGIDNMTGRMGVNWLLVPVALSSILIGLFLIVSRKKAVNQVLGFLVLENGIFTFGVGLVGELSLLVELGVLLDVFVAVFVMGIMIFHISREFDHLDTDRLSTLKD